jgi:hypothetical protein
MDLRRLRLGEWLAALSGGALLVSLFLPWYSSGSGADLSAWEAFAVNDVLLAGIALFALSLPVVTAVQAAPAVPIAQAAITTIAGLVAIVLVLVRLAWLPDLADSREAGIWLAFFAAIGVFISGVVAMRDERLSRPGRPTDPTGHPIEQPPEIEPLPAPRP